MKDIYLDYAATTPVDPAVFAAMEPYFTERFGNPGSLHAFGQEAIAAVDKSRESIAHTLGAEFRQIIFTGSATEANNLALRGAFMKFMRNAPGVPRPRIIISSVEHESVLETARSLEAIGAELILISVDEHGAVRLDEIKKSLTPETAIVSIMYANNEVGTIQPISEIAKLIEDFKNGGHRLLFHTDAVQALQFLDCSPALLGADLMTISSHKIYGPKGAGALYVRNAGLVSAIISGGGQEYGLRSGTENVPAIVGFAKAAEIAAGVREKEAELIGELRGKLWRGIKDFFPKAEINGAGANVNSPRNAAHAGKSLPNILNVYFRGRSAEELLTKFDIAGLAAASGSACRSRAIQSSHVIEAMRAGIAGGRAGASSEARAKSSIRFSLGRPTTEDEIDRALSIMRSIFTAGS